VETGLGHPVFAQVRPFFSRLKEFSLEELNGLSEERGLQTESGRKIRFVEPAPSDPYYEVHLFETGQVQTRPENRHDLFNALCWLAFPKTKARINAMHAAEIPREGGRRGRLRDMLTIFDEGGAIVAGVPDIEPLVRTAQWRELFVRRHGDFRIVVLGHAVLEQAIEPRPSITCKVVFADPADDLDGQAADAITRLSTPKELPPLPVFGYPGWLPESRDPGFYGDTRYFRPASRAAAAG
jgi:hypothetical protein